MEITFSSLKQNVGHKTFNTSKGHKKKDSYSDGFNKLIDDMKCPKNMLARIKLHD